MWWVWWILGGLDGSWKFSPEKNVGGYSYVISIIFFVAASIALRRLCAALYLYIHAK
jgi:hypothetical protein